jgi:ribosomal protein L37AE/L43A
MPKDFPHPLNEFIEEDIPVKKIRFDANTGKISQVTELEKQKTMYIDAKPEKTRCKSGEHYFKVINTSRGIFKCTKCPFHRQVYPTSYMYIDGKLISKATGKAV